QVVGWREWAALPDLHVPEIKVKIDTGAKTSAVHAYDISPFQKDGKPFVGFYLHPIQEQERPEIWCEAPVVDERLITSSNGEQESRFIIETTLTVGDDSWVIELSLANRDEMGFRMLLGRQAMRGRLIVDPERSFCLGGEDEPE
ncbi:MAG: ATP-dependent zinc protease, partial [Alphaproteobacteria bacterium]